MTSISDRCKTAREKATPGPWVYEEHKYCPYFEALHLADALGYPEPDQKESGCSNPTDPECDSCQTRYEVVGHPDGVWAENPPYHEANPADMRLAALAPEAAGEVVRLTTALEDLLRDSERGAYSTQTLSPLASSVHEATASRIRRILNPETP